MHRSIYINLLLTMYCLQTWPDHAIKREINRLLVKCHNHEMGCEWKGLFKDLIVSCFIYYEHVNSFVLLQDQHLSSCQYITVECRYTGCGDRVLLSKLEDHLKNECLQRLVECKDCGRKLAYKDLKVRDHPSFSVFLQVYREYTLENIKSKKVSWLECE